MSHFAVMVITKTKDEKELEAILQPYHEYECTGIDDEYVKFVPAKESLEQMKEDFSKAKRKKEYEYKNLATFISEWYGYEMRDGVYGRYTNPNAKWDWWELGGRWSGFLKLKPDARGIKGRVRVDTALKKDIDFEAMSQRSLDRELPFYDKVQKLFKEYEYVSWEDVKAKYPDLDEARRHYSSQEIVKKFREIEGIGISNSLSNYHMDRETFINETKEAAITPFAFVDENGWAEKGEMGWWGMAVNEQDNWFTTFVELLNRVPDDYYIQIVDAHI